MLAALTACAGAASPAASSAPSVSSTVSSSDAAPPAAAGSETTSTVAPSSRTGATSPASSRIAVPVTSVAAPTTLRGTIIDNDRPTCRVLQTETGRWALVGPGVDSVRVGDTVTVTGAAQPHLVSLCGRSFVVTSVQH